MTASTEHRGWPLDNHPDFPNLRRPDAPPFDPPVDADRLASGLHTTRIDGWTPERQRRFVEAIADGETVSNACVIVHMSPSSAYAFRRRPQGAAFALGWRSAALLAREALADTLLTRAMGGSTEAITRPDGAVITRHRLNDRLAMQLLTRLDRQVESETPGDLAAAKLVAGDFDAYLDLLAADAGPARAALFLTGRSDAAELEPIAALARADRRRREALGAGEDLADLDPADRHAWTAEQWARAEASGLVALAPTSPLSPLISANDAAAAPSAHVAADRADIPADPREGDDCPVWFSRILDEWRTNFPLSDDYYAEEDGEFGDPDYSRQLTEPEQEIVERLSVTDRATLARFLAEDALARDAWFAAHAAAKEAMPAADDAASNDETGNADEGEGEAEAEAKGEDKRAGEGHDCTRVPANAGTQGQAGPPSPLSPDTAAPITTAPARPAPNTDTPPPPTHSPHRSS